jgi:hypothetical protein
MSQISMTDYRTRPEPDEPYFEDALAGDPPTPLLERFAHAGAAGIVLMAAGLVVVAMIIWPL